MSWFRKSETSAAATGAAPPAGGQNGSVHVSITVNGKTAAGDIDPRTLLVQFLRENLRLTGTHVGCDTSQCGACVVHLDGQAVKSCTVLAASCDGAQVTTIEGLAKDGQLHPMQEAFRQHHGLQCGFCTPGMIMAAVDLANRNGGNLDEHTVREGLEGNMCRCTGYHNIVAAVRAGAAAMGSVRQAAE
jgi:aerobic carbon-monoxide dehydrogenase small subunit